MDDSVAARSDDEPIPLLTDESGEYPIEPVDDEDLPVLTLDPEARARVALRDRLVLRVFEEEFLLIARRQGHEALSLIRFEANPLRLIQRLELDGRARHIKRCVTRINDVLGLRGHECMTPFLDSLHDFIGQARFDWLRDKIIRRDKERKRRKASGTENADDLLWRSLFQYPKK